MKLKELLEKYVTEEILSESVVTEISELFESAVNEKAEAKAKEMVEAQLPAKEQELEEANSAELETFKAEMVEKLNDYVKFAVTEFMEENKPVIASELKVEMAESLVSGLIDSLKKNYVTITESELDVVSDLEEKVSGLEESYNESLNELIEKDKQIFEFEKALAWKDISESLTELDKTKVLDLVENIVFESVEDFKKKVAIVIEKVNAIVPEKTEVLEEEVEEISESSVIDEFLPTQVKAKNSK